MVDVWTAIGIAGIAMFVGTYSLFYYRRTEHFLATMAKDLGIISRHVYELKKWQRSVLNPELVESEEESTEEQETPETDNAETVEEDTDEISDQDEELESDEEFDLELTEFPETEPTNGMALPPDVENDE